MLPPLAHVQEACARWGSTPDHPTKTTLHGAYYVQPTHTVCCRTTHHRAVFHPSIPSMHVPFYTCIDVIDLLHLIIAFATFRKPTISFIMSVHPSVRPDRTTRLPLHGFPWKFVFEYFSEICRENSSFIKNLTRITGTLSEDQYIFLSYLAQFFLEWEMCQKNL